MSGICTYCGCGHGVHYHNCARIVSAIAKMQVPQPTAYDRAQAELNQHVASLAQMVTSLTLRLDRAHSRIEALEASGLGPHCAACREDHTTVALRLDALDREVGRHRVWLRLPDDVCMRCGTAFATKNHALNHTCNRAPVSPAAAYPPLPDEGT